jgi:hypothetical protein
MKTAFFLKSLFVLLFIFCFFSFLFFLAGNFRQFSGVVQFFLLKSVQTSAILLFILSISTSLIFLIQKLSPGIFKKTFVLKKKILFLTFFGITGAFFSVFSTFTLIFAEGTHK